MKNNSSDIIQIHLNWVQGFQKTHFVHSEAGSVPVQRGAQLLQLVVDTISLPT